MKTINVNRLVRASTGRYYHKRVGHKTACGYRPTEDQYRWGIDYTRHWMMTRDRSGSGLADRVLFVKIQAHDDITLLEPCKHCGLEGVEVVGLGARREVWTFVHTPTFHLVRDDNTVACGMAYLAYKNAVWRAENTNVKNPVKCKNCLYIQGTPERQMKRRAWRYLLRSAQ